MKDTREIFGIVEHVSLPILGLFDIAAKIDTGAFSGAMHVTDIKEYINEKGKKINKLIGISKKKIVE
jgi:hypothetical protein